MMFTEDLAPERRHRYTRLKHLGSGAFGEVFSLWDCTDGRKVAGKAIRTSTSSYSRDPPEAALRPVFREIHALRHLSPHPNIVNLLDVFPQSSELMLVFEFMPSDLQLVITKAQTPLPTAVIKV